MRHQAFIFAVMLVLGAPVAGQEVQIRSGDHAEFSRLTFDLPRRVDWSLETKGETAILKFSSGPARLDASAVFDRITRDRVGDVRVGDDNRSVEIDLACACEVTGFWHGQSMLVLDVQAKAEVESEPSPQALSPAETTASVVEEEITAQIVPALTPRRSPTLRLPLPDQKSPAAQSETPKKVASSPSVQAISVDQTRDQLLLEFGRAATQGLIDPALPGDLRQRLATPPSEPDGDASSVPLTIVQPSSESGPLVNVQVNVRTSIDDAFLSEVAGVLGQPESAFCLSDAQINVASWGDDTPFWDQIGPLRAGLVGEFDRLELANAKALARVYLYFGFGLEAREYIDLLPAETKQKPVLIALADIMEHGSAPDSVLSRQIDCNGPAALWSAMSYDRLPPDAAIDADAILRGFVALPKHLQAYLGPMLSRRFLVADLADESAQVLRVLERSDDATNAQADLVEAELEILDGDEDMAQDLLQTVIETNAEPAAEALVRRIDRLLARDAPVSFDLAQLAASYAFEHADSSIGDDLTRVHILALGASDAFADAFFELERAEEDLGDIAPKIRAELAGLLVQKADRMEFLQHVFAGRIGDPQEMVPTARLQFAQRLIDLGFHDQAETALTGLDVGPSARASKIMRAEIALSRDRPRQAEVELLGLTGADVNALRAQARSMAGEHLQAAALFQSAGMEREAERETWLAKQWSSPDETSGADNATEGGADQPGELAKNRSILASATQTRKSLEELLDDTDAPVLSETAF